MCTMKLNQELNGIELSFKVKPTQEIIDNLKSAGYKWSRAKNIWWTKQNETALQIAEKLSNGNMTEIKPVAETKIFDLWEVTHREITNPEIKNYDTKEIAKLIRKDLKVFASCKFSVRCGGYESIYIELKSSPFEKDSEYVKAIMEQVDKIQKNYNFCTYYDPYGDYGSSYNFYCYPSINYDYTQIEADTSKITEMYQNKKAEYEKTEQERKEKEYQEYLKQEAIRKAEYEKAEVKRQLEEKIINENVIVKNVTPYFVSGSLFANLNKNSTLLEYEEEIKKGDYYLQDVEISRELYFDESTYNLFKNYLLSDFDFINGTGGSDTKDNRIQSMTDYDHMTKQERESVKFYSCNSIGVYCENKLMFVIDAQGYSYARYIGLIGDNTIITKTIEIEQVLNNEQVTKLKQQVKVLEDLNVNTVIENNILETWNTTDFNIYRRAITQKIKDNNFKLTVDVVRQITNEKLKVVMYRVLKETDALQEQFTSANLKENDIITIYNIDEMIGELRTTKVLYIDHELIEYAQYKDAIKLIVKLPRKKGLYEKCLYDDCLIYKGDIILSDNLLYDIEERNGLLIKKGKYSSCDKTQYDVIIEYLANKGIYPIVNTIKPIF